MSKKSDRLYPYIRLSSLTGFGWNTKVEVVLSKKRSIDISGCVQKAEVFLDARKLVSCQLLCPRVFVDDLRAKLGELQVLIIDQDEVNR